MKLLTLTILASILTIAALRTECAILNRQVKHFNQVPIVKAKAQSTVGLIQMYRGGK